MPHQMVANEPPQDIATHYKVLDLPLNLGADTDISAQQLRAAYRRALFQHHPDKNGLQPTFEHDIDAGERSSKKATYTVDQITDAYTTLSVPKLRSEYDRVLKLQAGHGKGPENGDNQIFRSGLEIVDLDDLNYDEIEGVWFKNCRCGDGRGFQIREADLEEASDIGELHVGCRGCSLWLQVLFGIAEEKIVEDKVTGSRLEGILTSKDHQVSKDCSPSAKFSGPYPQYTGDVPHR